MNVEDILQTELQKRLECDCAVVKADGALYIKVSYQNYEYASKIPLFDADLHNSKFYNSLAKALASQMGELVFFRRNYTPTPPPQ